MSENNTDAPRRSTRRHIKPTVFSPSKPETMRMPKSFGQQRVVNQESVLTEEIVEKQIPAVSENNNNNNKSRKNRRRKSLVEIHEEVYKASGTKFSSFQRRSPPVNKFDAATPVVSKILSKTTTPSPAAAAAVFRSPTDMMRTPGANRHAIRNTLARAQEALQTATQLTQQRNLAVERVPDSATRGCPGSTPCAKKYLSSLSIKKRSRPNLKFVPYVSPVADIIPQIELSFRQEMEEDLDVEEEHHPTQVSFCVDAEPSVHNETIIVDNDETCASENPSRAWAIASMLGWVLATVVLAAWTYRLAVWVAPKRMVASAAGGMIEEPAWFFPQAVDYSVVEGRFAVLDVATFEPAMTFASEFATLCSFVIAETSADAHIMWSNMQAAIMEAVAQVQPMWWNMHAAIMGVVADVEPVLWSTKAAMQETMQETMTYAQTMWWNVQATVYKFASNAPPLWQEFPNNYPTVQATMVMEVWTTIVNAWHSLVNMFLQWEQPFGALHTFPVMH